MTKTVVESDKNAAFWMKGVNLSDESVMLFMFKNEKVGIMSKIVDSSGTLSLSPGKDGPSVFYITNYLSKRHLEELRIDLSDLRDIERRQLEDLHLSYADIFSRGKRDICKYIAGVQHHILLNFRDYSSQTTCSQSHSSSLIYSLITNLSSSY